MANIHRIQWIDKKIRDGSFPNCRDIQDEFEISHRQAARDIEYMRYSLNAPVSFSRKYNGFYYEDNSFMLPAFFLTKEEKLGLSYLSKRYGSMKYNKTAAILSNLFSKLSEDFEAVTDSNEIKVANLSEIEIEVFDILKNSIIERKKVGIVYLSGNMEKTSRIIHPYSLYIKNGNSFLEGYCELRNEARIFRLDRIISCEKTGDFFIIDAAMKKGNSNPMYGKKPFIGVIFFEKAPAGTEYSEFSIKKGLCTIEFFNADRLLGSVLSSGVMFRILSPNWLKSMLKERLTGILRYNDFSDI